MKSSSDWRLKFQKRKVGLVSSEINSKIVKQTWNMNVIKINYKTKNEKKKSYCRKTFTLIR